MQEDYLLRVWTHTLLVWTVSYLNMASLYLSAGCNGGLQSGNRDNSKDTSCITAVNACYMVSKVCVACLNPSVGGGCHNYIMYIS